MNNIEHTVCVVNAKAFEGLSDEPHIASNSFFNQARKDSFIRRAILSMLTFASGLVITINPVAAENGTREFLEGYAEGKIGSILDKDHLGGIAIGEIGTKMPLLSKRDNPTSLNNKLGSDFFGAYAESRIGSFNYKISSVMGVAAGEVGITSNVIGK